MVDENSPSKKRVAISRMLGFLILGAFDLVVLSMVLLLIVWSVGPKNTCGLTSYLPCFLKYFATGMLVIFANILVYLSTIGSPIWWKISIKTGSTAAIIFVALYII